MSITVMRQALEAIATGKEKFEAITALRLAIEQAEKVEPVAASGEDLEIYMSIARGYFAAHPPTAPAQDLSRLEPFVHGLGKAILRELQAAPAQQPLSDEQLQKLHHEDQFGLFCGYDDFEQIARAIEQAHGIKGASHEN